MVRGNGGLWRRIGRQTLWGRRGLMKTGTLWLPVAAALSFMSAGGLRGACVAGMALFAASALRTMGTILANDLCDRAEDAAAAKERWIQQLPGAVALTIVVALFGVGVALLPAAGAPAGAVGAYVLASLLGLAYSVPPLRMKCRGLAGLVCYSVCCATAYALVPAAWLRPPWQVLALTGALVLLDRWVNLNFHQVLDREADAAGGCATYAVRAEAGGARRTLRGFAVLASLAAAALLVFVGLRLRPWGTAVALVGAAAALAAWGYGALSRRLPDRSSPLIRELPPYYLGLTYAAFWVLPPLLLAGRAFVEPSVWVLAALAALSSLLTTARMAGYRHA